MGRLGREMVKPMKIEELVGQELVSEWRTIEQERIEEFARATDDHQWIHVDPEQAAAGPFGTTIAHGFLTLSLVVPMFAEALPPLEGYGMSLNYGLNRVRFTSPVPSGSRIRGRFRIEEVADVTGGKQARVAGTIELEGQEKPACVAEALFRFLEPVTQYRPIGGGLQRTPPFIDSTTFPVFCQLSTYLVASTTSSSGYVRSTIGR